MISLLEIAERAYKGPKMGEKEWNLGLFKKMQELVNRHRLAYSGPDLFFGVDDDYVDSTFKAAVDFLSEMGVYCITTNRVIQFEREEVLAAAKEAPKEVVIGEGRDVRVIRKRGVEDTKLVNVISGGSCPWPQEVAVPLHAAYARVLRGDMIGGFNFTEVDGHEIHGLPIATYAAKKEAIMMREVVRMAGRPGMAITFYPILTSAGPMIAPIDIETGLRRTDGVLLSILPDIKVEADYIASAIIYDGHGCYKSNGGFDSVVGGFCGGIEGAIIENIVKAMAAWMIYRANFHYSGMIESFEPKWRPETEDSKYEAKISIPVWPTYVVHRALERNSNIIRFGGEGTSGVGGMGSESDLLTIANNVAASTVSGCNLVCLTGGNPTPFHVEFSIQVADATAKARIRRKEVPLLLEKVNEVIRERLHGQPFTGHGDRRMLAYQDFEKYYAPMSRLYDFMNQLPRKTFMENARKVNKVLKDLGLDLEAAAI